MLEVGVFDVVGLLEGVEELVTDTDVLEDATELDAGTEGVGVGTCELEDTKVLDSE